jgi:FkbM family methyltransferase
MGPGWQVRRMIKLLHRPWAALARRLTWIHLNALREAGVPELLAALEEHLATIGLQVGTIEERQAGSAPRMDLLEKSLLTLAERLGCIGLQIGAIAERQLGSAARMGLIEKRCVILDERLAAIGPQIGLIDNRNILIYDILSALAGRQVVPLDAGFLATRTPVGWIVLPDTEVATLLHLADGRNTQEPGTVRFLQDQLPDDGHAIDVGAHVGTLTTPMARAVARSGRVDALEPVPRNVAALRRTIAANQLEATVQVHQAAADAVTGAAQFSLGANGQLGTLIGAESALTGMIEVTTVCLDDIKPPGSRINLVKIDAEGAELRVLAGMRRVIADNPGLVVVAEFGPSHLRPQGVSIKDWFEAFAQAGLKVATEIDEATCTVTKLRPADALERVFSINIAFSASIETLTPPNRPR